MTDAEKLPVPETGVAPSTQGTATPSEFSVMDEKERNVDSVDEKAQEEIGTELTPVESSPYPSTKKLVGILVGVSLSMFLVSLDMTIVATAIPRITDQFKSLEDVGWYGSGFFLTFAAFQSMWGKAYKYFDLKWVFMFCCFVFEVGSLVCAVAPNSEALIVGRAIAGMGGAGIASGGYVFIFYANHPT